MAERKRLPMPFGVGIDRAEGVGEDVPRVEDLRNVLPKEGVWAARKGLEETVQITMNGALGLAQDINFIGLVKSSGVTIVVASIPGGAAVTNNIQVFTISNLGFNPAFVTGSSRTLGAAGGRMIVSGVDTYNRMFLAHDEADITLRLATMIYRADTNATSILNKSLDGGSAADVKFRGVSKWLDRLVGWGYGSATEADRPEIVRLSLPGEPDNFKPEHYFVAGARSEPVLGCIPARTSLLVFKQQSIYEIFGNDQSNFGIRLQDPRFGAAAGRLCVEVNGTVYFWSLEGPRAVQPGGESVDLGIPLDLEGPQPGALALEGIAELGWAHYVPEDRLIEFAFPNPGVGKTRIYGLSLRDPRNPRWVYIERQVALLCAGTVWSAAGGAPTGYPATGTPTSSGQTVTLPWTNTSAAGDETVEVWFKRGSGAWTKYTEVFVSGSSQSVTLGLDAGILPGETVTLAARYRRGIKYTSGYEDPVTSGWTATPVTNSTESITLPAAPAQPYNTSVVGTSIQTVGSKDYLLIEIAWQNAIAAGAFRTVEYLEAGVNNPAAAAVVGSVAIVGGVASAQSWAGLGNWLIGPGSAPRWVWIRHKDEAGLTSGLAPVLGPDTDGSFNPGSGA